MKNYLISVITIALIISIITVILPRGKLSKYVKSVCSFILAFSIVSPLMNFNEYGYTNIFTEHDYEIKLQEEYITYVFESKKTDDYKKIEQILNNNGINYSDIKIEYNVTDKTDFYPKKISVKLLKINTIVSKDVLEEIKKTISEVFKINMENIIFYG